MSNSSIKKYYIISYTSYNFPYNPPKYFKQPDDFFLIDQETGELIHHITPQTFDFNKESYI